MRKFIYTLIISAFLISGLNTVFAAPAAAPVKEPPAAVQLKTAPKTCPVQVLNVSPLDVVNNPSFYLNKTISFSGEFVSFTSLGLDYKPAFRESSKYIGLLIKRPDVKEHTIPLSEFKMLMTRELAEKHIDIESGDKFKLTGKVFSNALGDPWMDITEFEVTEKKNKEEKSK